MAVVVMNQLHSNKYRDDQRWRKKAEVCKEHPKSVHIRHSGSLSRATILLQILLLWVCAFWYTDAKNHPFFYPAMYSIRNSIPRSNRASDVEFGVAVNVSTMVEDLLHEGDGPVDRAAMQERLVVRGQMVAIECGAMRARQRDRTKGGHSSDVVRWYHDNKLVAQDTRVSVNPNTWRVEISHAISADSGVWRCVVDNSRSPPLNLVVTIPPERPYLVYGGATLAVGARITTREGNTLTLRCVVNGGNPAPTIAWYIGDKEVTDTSKTESKWRGVEQQYRSISNMTIVKVNKTLHNTTVACLVSQPALPSPVAVPLRLNIEYPPNFKLRRWPGWGVPVVGGSDVSLQCIVEANPPSLPRWIKVDPTVKTVAGRRSSGDDDLDQEDLKAPNSLGVQEDVQRGYKRTTRTIWGEVGRNSRRDLKSETDVTSVLPTTDGGWLNLTDVGNEERGWYQCVSWHAFGEYSSNSVYINVQTARSSTPAVLSDSTRGADVQGSGSSGDGNSLQHSIGSIGGNSIPPSAPVCWGRILTTGTSNRDSNSSPRPQLGLGESGIYQCNAPEDDSHNNGPVKLVITGAPVVEAVSPHVSGSLGGSVLLSVRVCSLTPLVEALWLPPQRSIPPLKPGQTWGRYMAHNITISSDGCRVCGLRVSSSSRTDAGVWVVVGRTAHAANAASVILTLSQSLQSSTRSNEQSGLLEDPYMPATSKIGGVHGDDSRTLDDIRGSNEENYMASDTGNNMAQSVTSSKESGKPSTGGKVLSSSVSASSSSSPTFLLHLSPLIISLIYTLSATSILSSCANGLENFSSTLGFIIFVIFILLDVLYVIFIIFLKDPGILNVLQNTFNANCSFRETSLDKSAANCKLVSNHEVVSNTSFSKNNKVFFSIVKDT